MDLPEEDDTALRKRSAIQKVMKDPSLSGTDRHAMIQKIMRGDFDHVDLSDDSSHSSDDSRHGNNNSDGSSGSFETDSEERSYETDNDHSGSDSESDEDSRSSYETDGSSYDTEEEEDDNSSSHDDTAPSIITEDIQTIITKVQTNDPTLTAIHLPSQNLNDTILLPLFSALSSNTHVTSLSLPHNRISNEGCTTLASSLLDNSKLSTLDLSYNSDIGTRGIMELAKALPYNYTLKQLNLSHIHTPSNTATTKNNGATLSSELALALNQNESLREFTFNGNSIGDVGASYLFQMLSSHDNTTLERIQLACNDIGDGGAHALANALLENETLVSVDLTGNCIGGVGARDILKVLEVNDTLVEVLLEGNEGIEGRILEEIGRALGSDGDNDDGESSSYDSGSESGEDDVDDAPLTGGEAMLTDMPDEDDKALAKRQLIQQIMRDKSLSATDRNKKIQDVMAGKVELPKVEQKSISKSKSARKHPPLPPTSRSSKASPAQLTGGEAMLTDMADEDDKALAKRQLIQQIMKDKSLSASDRNQKIQDVMAGRVELSKEVPKSAQAAAPASENEKQPEPSKPKKGKRVKSKPAPTTGKKDEGNNEKKMALQTVMMDSSLSEPERQQKIQEIMEGGKSSKTAPPTNEVKEQPTNGNAAVKERKNNKSKQRRKDSMDSTGMAPTNMIAQEWKKKMMEPHPRSHDDLLDILLAHKYRLSLQSPPKQSCFRVVAVVFFSIVVNGVRRPERYHVVGTNDEPHSIAGSICAERAALMQLRFMPNLESITKIVIVTDDADSVSPGMLCREFMASHDRVPWDVPIILGRSVCKKCGFSITGNVCGDKMSRFNASEEFQETQRNIFAMCSAGHAESKYKQYSTPHDFLGTATTLRELFPYPSLYTRLSGREALQLGERYMENDQRSNGSSPKKKKVLDSINVLGDSNSITSDDASTGAGSFRQENFDLTMLTDIIEDEETENVDSDVKKRPALEKACSSTSITQSLKTTIDFMRQIQEDTGNQTNNLGLVPESLDRLTASKIRVSSRLKPSQRREKLLKMATEATVYETPHQRNTHPIRYGAAVLFSDNTVSIASQKVAIEYGCTLDAVGQLASIIDRKALQLDEHKPPVRPILLVQCDQFGIAHPPFAQGRAFLTERGYGDCKILLHQQRQSRPHPTIMEEKSMRDFDEEEKKQDDKVDLRLIEVDANSLAPSPPDIFGVVTNKTHSSTLQIQF